MFVGFLFLLALSKKVRASRLSLLWSGDDGFGSLVRCSTLYLQHHLRGTLNKEASQPAWRTVSLKRRCKTSRIQWSRLTMVEPDKTSRYEGQLRDIYRLHFKFFAVYEALFHP